MYQQKTYSKKQALEIFSQASKLYRENLKNKNLLILYKYKNYLKYYEIEFIDTNFLHFTGVKTNLSPKKYYNSAVDQRLKESDFVFKNNQMTSKKIDVLQDAVSIHTTAKTIGLYNGLRVELQADVGAGNTKYVMTLGFDEEKGMTGFIQSEYKRMM